MNQLNKRTERAKRESTNAHASHRGWRVGAHWQQISLLAMIFVILGGLFGVPLARAGAQQCTNLLADGGFESGAGWSIQTTGNYGVLSDYLVHQGVRAAYLAGTDSAQDTVSATVTLPANQSASLNFWWQVHTEEEGSDYDGLTVLVADASGTPVKSLMALSNVDAVDTWQQSEIDLSEFAGQTIQLQFRAQTDETLSTDFFIDDVALNTCSSADDFNIFLPFTSRS